MHPHIQEYNDNQTGEIKTICKKLAALIDENLLQAESKIWHAHPVWFIDNNPIVGYSLQKPGLRLMFWSGASFEESCLAIKGEKFKDASIFYNHIDEINEIDVRRCLKKAIHLQWDYKNLIKRKGKLEPLSQHLK